MSWGYLRTRIAVPLAVKPERTRSKKSTSLRRNRISPSLLSQGAVRHIRRAPRMIPAHAYEARSAQNHRGRSNLRRACRLDGLVGFLSVCRNILQFHDWGQSDSSYLMLNRWNSLRRNVLQFRSATA
jgi:hypothetical protein